VSFHRFAKMTIELSGKVKGPHTAGQEPNEADVKGKVRAALEKLDIGGGYELVDVNIKKYDKTPET
jgi:hypothetical protein